ncbi:hypothetical protein HPULCUR_000327 [Helicostylum pulchrum]|uniref:Uncharacterized protein n=1 Tax=Helicostylum pulchrum TaxID=562976 RepID=A0ABP9XLP5_9FUNG
MMEPPQKLVVIKSSITGIGWKDVYKQRLMELVKNVDIFVTHTYFFLKFIFVNELEDDNTDYVFNLEDFINEDFFREVFMSLLSAYKMEKRKKTKKPETFKTIINKHRETFLERTSYKPIDLKYGQQIANYEVTKIRTAHINNITSKDATSEFLGQNGMNIIKSFIGYYSEDYKFEKGSIFYDCKTSPVKHLRAYYQIAKTCEALQGGKSINCFPIRTMFIPCYMTIDTLILNTQILKNMVLTHLDKQAVWGGAINLNSKGTEPQGSDKQMKFRGMIYTDGVGVSILKQNYDPRKRGGKKSKKQLEDKDSFKYIEDLKKEDLLADVGKCVLVDPGRRDLLYCMHENSTSQTKMVYRYTSNQKGVETKSKKFRKLRNRFKPDEVIAAELSLSYYHATSVNKKNFVKYLEARANVSEGLNNCYSNEDIPPEVRAADRLPFRKNEAFQYY